MRTHGFALASLVLTISIVSAALASTRPTPTSGQFTLDLGNLQWDGDPHAKPSGTAVLRDAASHAAWEMADVIEVVVSEDHSTGAVLTRDGDLFVSNFPEPPRAIAGSFLSPALSPDGRQLLAQKLGAGEHILDRTFNTEGIALVEVLSGEQRLIVLGNDVYAPSFASSGRIFLGSGGKEQIASLYLLDAASNTMAKITNVLPGQQQTFPNQPPREAGSDIICVADGIEYRVPTPTASEFRPLTEMRSPSPIVSTAAASPDYGWVRLRRPGTTYGYPNIYQYFDHGGRDWGCGYKRYAGHQGTDFNQSFAYNVVAPASGTVIYRYDGCPNWSSWGCGYGWGNHVALQHADGNVSLVGHGQAWTIAGWGWKPCAATLMRSASSGNSNAFHVHHEVWTSSAGYGNPGYRYDPYLGSCDPGDPSKWSGQGAYGYLPGTGCAN